MNPIQESSGPSASLLAAVNPAKADPKTSTAQAQDRFMTLLVTQMKNQDPLNPLDNAQVTSQLAQLSTVTGIDKLNTTLESLQGSYQSSQSLQAANLIGHGVLAAGSSTQLSNGKAVLGVEFTEPADKAVVTIRDAAGKAVRTLDLGGQEIGLKALQWDGVGDDGKPALDGKYSIDVSATRAGQKSAAATLGFGEVGSVSTGAQGVKLNVQGLGTVNFADVRQIL